MKKIFYAIAGIAAFSVLSCSKETDIPDTIVEKPHEAIEVPASLSCSMGTPGTKVSSDNSGIYKWQSTDEITILTDNGNNRTFTTEEAGFTTDFAGTRPDADNLPGGYALYPASKGHSVSEAIITFNIPDELVWNADASNMPMYASITEVEEKPSAAFKAVGGSLKLICYNIPSGATKLAFTAKSVNIAGNFSLNTTAEEPSLSGEGSGNEIVIDFSDDYSVNKVFYIPLPPVTLTGGFTITIYDGEQKVLFSTTTTASPTIARNKLVIAPALNCAKEIVLWSEDFSGYAADAQPSSKGSVNYGYGENGTKVYTTQLGSGGAGGPELLIKSGGGTYTVSNIPTGKATTMTLTFMTNRNLTLSSTTDGVSLGSISSNGNARTVLISNSNDASVFDIEFKNTLSNNARIDDIKVVIDGEEFTAPSITATDDALTFDVGESSKTTTLDLSNAIDNLGISAAVSGTNKDNFTASIEGTTLTVTAKAPNTTAADYSATVTLKASGAAAKTIAVIQTSCLVPNPTELSADSGNAGATITWTKDEHATSYLAYLLTDESENPATDDGVLNVSDDISISDNTCTLELSGLTNNTTYHLYVKVNGVAENYAAPSDYVHVSFMPVSNKELVSIALTTPPTKTTYSVGDTFSFDGAVVTATYSDNSQVYVTGDCTTDYDNVTFDAVGEKTITISYTDGVTRTTTFNVTVAIVDVLTNTTTGVGTTTSYGNWSGKSKDTNNSGIRSDAVYAGNSAGNYGAIQLRSSDNSGIITTGSGGNIGKISVSWNSNTVTDRTLYIYGKNVTYSGASDLYNNSSRGTLLGSIVCGTSTELTVTGDYEYVGLRSSSGAMYLDEIRIQWEPAATKYDVTIDSGIENGSVAASVNKAKEGDTVNLTATPDAGYALSAWDVYKTDDSSTKITVTDNTFTMPAYAVTVSASFAAVPTISMNITSISDVPAEEASTTATSAYNLLNGALNSDITITCDGTIVTAASKNVTAGSIDYSVSANSGNARSGWIKVQYANENPHEITVNQLAGGAPEPTLQYTLDGTITATGNAYATASTLTQSSIGWKVVANTEMSPWRIGGKGISGEDRAIYSTTAISANITSIEVKSGATANSLSVNSLTISVHSSASEAASGSNAIDTKTVTSGIASSTVTFEKSDNTSWAGKYYRIVYNVTRTSTSGNGYITFENAKFYGL